MSDTNRIFKERIDELELQTIDWICQVESLESQVKAKTEHVLTLQRGRDELLTELERYEDIPPTNLQDDLEDMTAQVEMWRKTADRIAVEASFTIAYGSKCLIKKWLVEARAFDDAGGKT